MIKLSKIKPHPDNPRLIKDESFHKLCESLKTFPEMMAKREIIIDTWTNPIILCGNQRYKALKEIGYKEIPDKWIKTAEDLTDDQKKELMIKDNIQAGDWDEDILSEWNQDDLNEWGIDQVCRDPELKGRIKVLNQQGQPAMNPAG
jgi:ParB-like chromosome segregation protein Spo0J